jgi:hypothetical protein
VRSYQEILTLAQETTWKGKGRADGMERFRRVGQPKNIGEH